MDYRKQIRMDHYLWSAVTLALVSFLGHSIACADLSQNFQQWDTPAAFSNYETNGWQLNDAAEYNNYGILNTTDSNLRSPFSSNGVGVISWQTSEQFARSPVVYELRTSPDNTNWTTIATYTSDVPVGTWQSLTNTDLAVYEGRYVQWYQITGSPHLAIDNVNIGFPPSFVVITNVAPEPEPPVVETATDITADVWPQAGASNLTVSAFYRTNTTAAFTEISMSTTGSNHYVTDSPIPAFDTPNLAVEYYIGTDFDGRYDSHTAYYPASGSSGPTSMVLRAKSPYSEMTVQGSGNTNLVLVDNNTWEGVFSPEGSLTEPVFYFEAGTNTWGDDMQSVSNLPVYGTAQSGSTNISVGETVTGHLAFAFEDNIQDYSIQRSEYVSFDSWTNGTTVSYSTYTNSDGWVLHGGRVSKDSDSERDRALRGRFGILKHGEPEPGDTLQYLRSPHMSEGIGSVAFWYRNWENDGDPPAGLAVQTSETGSGDWINLSDAGITNIVYAGYLRTKVNVGDRNAHYVRIVNTNSTQDSWLCLDEVIVTHPGATVDLVDPQQNPAEPLLGSPVDVSIATTNVAGGATNIECRTWFRATNSTEFTSIEMTYSNGVFYATIPPTPAGEVDYYYKCTYDGFNAGTAYYPAAGAASPLVYTNQSFLGSAREQDFQAWSTPLEFGDYTDSAGWSLHHGAVFNDRGLLGPSSENPTLTTPELTNGVGSIHFDLANFQSGPNAVEVQTSTGTTWTTVATVTNSQPYPARNSFQVPVNSVDITQVRFLKITDGGDNLYIDNVVVSLPPADVDINGQYFSPGYPMTGDTVTVSGTITSRYEIFPAYNIEPQVVYRWEAGPWSSAPMTQAGSNVYSAAIPEQRPGVVEYYIECDFDGYYYGNEKQNPAFLPDAPATNTRPDTYFSYNVRYHDSEYSHLRVTSTVDEVEMDLIGDNYWQGVIAIESPTNEVSLGLSGYNRWLGDAYSEEADSWGETNQTRYALPVQGQADAGGTNLIVRGDFAGTNQVVVRYDIDNGTYLIFSGAFQDFDEWNLGSTEYFEQSLAGSGKKITSITNTFDSWPTNSISPTLPDTATEDIEEWTYGTYYDDSARSDLSENGWYCQAAHIIGDPYAGEDQALRLDPTDDHPFDSGKIWPFRSTLTKGVDTFSFKYRWSVDDDNLTYYELGSELTNYLIEATVRTADMSPRPRLSVLARYQDADNYYEYRLESEHDDKTDQYNRLYRHNGGDTTWLKASHDDGHQMNYTQEIEFSVCSNNGGYVSIYAQSRDHSASTVATTDTDTGNVLSSPGSFGFLCQGTDLRLEDVKVKHMHRQDFNNWVTDPTGWIMEHGNAFYDTCLLDGNADASLTTPYLNYDVGSIRFEYRRRGSGSCELEIRGSVDSNNWSTITNWTVSNDNWKWNTVTQGLSGYRYLQIRNTNSSSTQLRLDNITIQEDGYFYSNSFDSASSTSDWVDVAGNVWYHDAENGSYNRPGEVAPYAEDAIEFVVQKGYTNGSTAYAPTSWIDVATLTADSMHYATNTIEFEYWDELFLRVKHKSGQASLVLDDLEMTRWRGTDSYTDTNGWKGTGLWVTQEGTDSNRYVELWRSRINPEKAQYIRSPQMAGIGAISFDYKGQRKHMLEEGFNDSTNTPNGWSITNGFITNGYCRLQGGTNASLITTNLSYTNVNKFEMAYRAGTDDECKPALFGSDDRVNWTAITNWSHTNRSDGPSWTSQVVTQGLGGYNYFKVLNTNSATAPLDINSITISPPTVQFEIQLASTAAPEDFFTQETLSITNEDWQQYSYAIQTNTDVFARIKHSSSYDGAVLYLDNVRITDYLDRDERTWEAYNALISPLENDIEFETNETYRTCYLNNDPVDGTRAGEVFENDRPYIQSPRMENGIGEISFWYRTWEDDSTPPATFYLRSSATPDGGFDDWTPIAQLSGITNQDYRYFVTNHYNSTHKYVRVYSETNAGNARLCLDNLLISQPLAVDFGLTNLVTIPNIPLYSSPVDISVDMVNPILDPVNVKARAYYQIGTNHWGQWDQWDTNNYIDLDYIASSSPVARTYQSDGPSIPQMGIDTVVQYYVEFTFDGPHADKTSPKTYSFFTNPEHYEPVDLNDGQSDSTPYYFVFSCRPGEVFINEYNILDGNYDYSYQYVELAGRQGVNISNWNVQVLNEPTNSPTLYRSYSVTNDVVFGNATNGYGFWLLASNGVPNAQQRLTGSYGLYDFCGIRLKRSMGAYEQTIWDRDLPDTEFNDWSVSMVGTGTVAGDFIWDNETDQTEGAINQEQVLLAYSQTQTLHVTSAYGTPSPAQGTHYYPRGTKVTCSVDGSPIENGTMSTQYLCTGWTGVGDIPGSGSSTNTGEIMLVTDSEITWNWITNLYLNVQTSGNGSVDNTGWFKQYSAVTVTASAAEYNAFNGWTGDTNGCSISSNVLVIDSHDRPRGPITAHFESTDRTLDVNSTYAGAGSVLTPPPGTHIYHDSTQLACVTSNRIINVGSQATQMVATGWASTGSVPEMPQIGSETGFTWKCDSGIAAWQDQDANGWKAALVADGDDDGLGNMLRDSFATNGISVGDDRILTTTSVVEFGGTIFWDSNVNADMGLRVFTVVFNSTNITDATHYVVPTNSSTFFTVNGQTYDSGTADSSEWIPLVSPATNDTIITTGPFNITNDSSINWQWDTNHYLDTQVEGTGTVDVADGWFSGSTTVTVNAYSDTNSHFGSWTGDVSGCSIDGDRIDVPMDRPRTVTAVFLAGPGTTEQGTPYSWLEQYYTNDLDYYDTNDTDLDGMEAWEEYVTGTDPTNENSTFRILDIGTREGSNYVTWYATTNSGVYEPFGMYRTTNMIEGWDVPYTTNTGPRDPEGTGTNIWWDEFPPPADKPVFYRPYVNWTNSQ